MRNHLAVFGAVLACSVLPQGAKASAVEKIRNVKVVVTEESLDAGQVEPPLPDLPSMIVYMSDGRVKTTGAGRTPENVSAGETVFEPAHSGALKNTGAGSLHLVRIQFLTAGADEIWGKAGLAPHYKLLVENRFARAYDIKIPAHTREPLHTHHDRVVVSLSGAKLEHMLPSGEVQPSTLKTGEIVWRRGGTHVGHNLGDTNLWVIAVEPK